MGYVGGTLGYVEGTLGYVGGTSGMSWILWVTMGYIGYVRGTSLSNVTGVVQGWAGHRGSLLLVSNQTLFPGFPMLVSP